MSEDTDSTDPSDRLPDFTHLYDVAKELGDEMVLDFRGRVGAHPFARWTGDEWEAMSISAWDQNDEGRAIISAKEIELTDEEVQEMLEDGPIVQLVWYRETPFDGYEEWEYTGIGEE